MNLQSIRKVLNAYGFGRQYQITYIEEKLKENFQIAWGNQTGRRISLRIDGVIQEEIALDNNDNVLKDGIIVEADKLSFIDRETFRYYSLADFYNKFVERSNLVNPLEGAFTEEELAHLPYGDNFPTEYHSGAESIRYTPLRLNGDDHSPLVAVELEGMGTNFNRVCELPRVTPRYRLLGKPEHDGTVSFEWPTSPISMARLVTPGFKKEFGDFLAEFGQEGLSTTVSGGGAGAHMHIDKEWENGSFDPNKPEGINNFLKLYYVIHCKEFRNFWLTISKRPEQNVNGGGYWQFSDSLNRGCNGKIHLMNSAKKHCYEYNHLMRNDHGVALNNQHAKTLEFRFWNATFSLRIIIARAQILTHLMQLILDGATSISVDDLRDAGDEAKWYINVNTNYGSDQNASVDLSFIDRNETFPEVISAISTTNFNSMNRTQATQALRNLLSRMENLEVA